MRWCVTHIYMVSDFNIHTEMHPSRFLVLFVFSLTAFTWNEGNQVQCDVFKRADMRITHRAYEGHLHHFIII